MSKSESDAMTSGSESESDEEEVPMQTTDESDLSDNDSDSGSDISDESEPDSDSEHSSSGASDSEVDESTREAAAAAVRAIAEREAQKQKRREMNAKKKAAKAEATAAAAPATPAATAAGASTAVAAATAAAPGAAPSTLLNKLIKDLVPDYYYHLGLSSEMDLKAMFGDVRFVLLSGSAVRAAETAVKLVQALGVAVPTGCTLSPIGKTERYSIYKAGPVLSVSHGMGKPSISIMLHELTKMLAAAGVLDKTTYIRIGTSGGVGAEPGTVIVSSGTVNGALEPTFPIIVLGKTIHRPCRIEPKLVSAIMASSGALAAESGFKVVKGLTMATDDFYEGQGRLDGAIAEYTLEDKMAFLRLAHKSGVKNIEMESDCIVAFCTRLNIRCAVVCAAIVNRLNGDQVTSTPEQLVKFTDNAVQVSIRYIQKELGLKPVKAPAAGGKAKPPVLAQGQQGKGNKAVPHVAGSGTDFPQCTVGHDHTGAPQTRACTKSPTPAASSKKKNKPDNQNQNNAASSKKKGDKKGANNAQNGKQGQSQSNKKDKKNNNNNGPKTPVKGAATAPSTPAASGKKNKNKGPKTPNGAAPATPAAVAAGTPAPLSHAEKVIAAAAAVAAKEAAKTAAAAASSKKKKGDAAAATPKKDAAATPAATPAASEKKKKKEKAAANGATPAATPAKPAAAPATPGAPATAPLNRREKKRLADEAAAAAKAAAESKAAADAATIAANRASDLLKFDPDAAAFPKVKRPNKNERAAEKQRKALEALAQTNAPAANGAAFATPAKAANGSAPTASATVDGKKRKLEDEPAANGKAAPATEAKKSKKAKKDE